MFLGIDLGTSAVKARVYDGDGVTRGSGRATYPIEAPRPDWAETDPDAWWDATVEAVRAAVAGNAGAIRAIGVAGQMHGVVLVDASGTSIRPAVIWPDTRSAGHVAGYDALDPSLRAGLGNPVVTGMAGPTLLWIEEHEPNALRATRWVLQPKDWLRLRLTGEIATDPTDASGTLLYDIVEDGWAHGAIDALGLDADVLPPVRAPNEVGGRLVARAATELGMPDGVPVAVGAADTAGAIHGRGLALDDVQLTIGSGAQIVVLRDRPEPAPERGVHVFRAVGARRWYRMAAVQNAGLALRWARCALDMTWDEMYASLEHAPPGSDGLVLLPYLTGERTPHMDPRARAGWIGAGLQHGRTHLARAALEGVAFAIADAFEALLPEGSRSSGVGLAGGGSVAPAWRQLLADLLRSDLIAGSEADVTVRGAARLAAACVGERLPPTGRSQTTVRYEPQPVSDALRHARNAFRDAYARLRSHR